MVPGISKGCRVSGLLGMVEKPQNTDKNYIYYTSTFWWPSFPTWSPNPIQDFRDKFLRFATEVALADDSKEFVRAPHAQTASGPADAL